MKKLAIVTSRNYYSLGARFTLYKNPEDLSEPYILNSTVVDIYDPQTNTTQRVWSCHKMGEFNLIGDVVEYDDELKTITRIPKVNPEKFDFLLKLNEYYENYFSESQKNANDKIAEENIKPLDKHEVELILTGIRSAVFDIRFYNSVIRDRKIPGVN